MLGLTQAYWIGVMRLNSPNKSSDIINIAFEIDKREFVCQKNWFY